METPDADYARRTERIKNLLSSYYGTDGAAPASPTTSDSAAAPPHHASGEAASGAAAARGRPAAAAAAMMENPTYTADRYIAHVLKTYTLEKLLAEHRAMAREIKNLDSDMQQLVYENYSKFITATDTIRAMKAHVDGMGADMDTLQGLMVRVSEQSDAVNAKLRRRREAMEGLAGVQGILSRLQVVQGLPSRMRAALQEDAPEAAVGFYTDVQPVLKKYGHRAAFRGVAAEVEAVAREVAASLKRALADRRGDTERCVLLLRQLGEPDDSLQDKYLAGRSERLHRILREGRCVADAMAAAARGDDRAAGELVASLEVPEAWACEGAAPPSLRTFIKSLDERFINAMQETVVNVASIFLAPDAPAARRKPLLAVARQAMGAYFELLRSVVAASADAAVARAASAVCPVDAADPAGAPPPPTASSLLSNDWGTEAVAQALSASRTDVGLLHSALPELSVRDRAAEAVEVAVRSHVGGAFAALGAAVRRSAERAVTAAAAAAAAARDDTSDAAGAPAALSESYTQACAATQLGLDSLLGGLRGYAAQPRLFGWWRDAFSELVAGQVQALLLGLGAHCLQLGRVQDDSAPRPPPGPTTSASEAPCPSGATTAPPPCALLLLAKLCAHVEGSTVPVAMEALADGFAPQGGGGGGGSGSGGGRGDDPPAFLPGEVARRLGTASNLLLSAYVEAHGRSLSLLVADSLESTDWLNHAPPTAPRPVCAALVAGLQEVEGEVVRLVEVSGRGAGAAEGVRRREAHARGGSGSFGDAAFALESSAVERSVAKLFHARPKVLGAIKFTQAALLAAVAAVGLKSVVEIARLHTFGAGGLQQLQVDCAALRPPLRRLVGGGPAWEGVEALLDEVVAAAAARSRDTPVLLDAAAVERLVAAAAAPVALPLK